MLDKLEVIYSFDQYCDRNVFPKALYYMIYMELEILTCNLSENIQ